MKADLQLEQRAPEERTAQLKRDAAGAAQFVTTKAQGGALRREHEALAAAMTSHKKGKKILECAGTNAQPPLGRLGGGGLAIKVFAMR